jgi:hypothetical protein
MGSGGIVPRFFDVGFMPRTLYPRERAPANHWIGGWVGHRNGLDDVRKRKFLTLPGLELQPLALPALRQSLHRLCYPVSLRFPTKNLYAFLICPICGVLVTHLVLLVFVFILIRCLSKHRSYEVSFWAVCSSSSWEFLSVSNAYLSAPS